MERLTENSVASLGAGETPAHPGTCASSNRSSVPGTFQNDSSNESHVYQPASIGKCLTLDYNSGGLLTPLAVRSAGCSMAVFRLDRRSKAVKIPLSWRQVALITLLGVLTPLFAACGGAPASQGTTPPTAVINAPTTPPGAATVDRKSVV